MGCSLGKSVLSDDNEEEEKNSRRRSQCPDSNLSFGKKLSIDDDDYPDTGADADGDVLSCPSVKSFLESSEKNRLRYLSVKSVLSDDNEEEEENPRRRSQRPASYLSRDDPDGLRSSSSFKSLPEDGDGLSSASAKSFPEVHDLSFELLTEAIDSLDEISHRAFAAIRALELKDNIARKPELSSLVNDYFKNSADLLRFFIALCDRLTIVLDAFELFGGGNNAAAQSRLLEFRAVEYPFDSNVIEELLSERNKLYDALVARKEKLDKKLRSARKWRKVCFAVHKLVCAVGIISSLVLGLVGGPAGAITAATVATTACLSVGPWLKSRWDAYELGLKEQRDAVAEMGRSVLSSERMLRRVQSLVKRVDVAAESLLRATRDLEEKTAAAAEEEMEKKLGEIMKSSDSVEEEVERCRVKLRRASVVTKK